MGVPSGKVIATPMVARSCGCMREFQHYEIDRYRTQRLAKFQSTRCEVCVAKLAEEQKKQQASLPKKGEAFSKLPPGTQVTMKRNPDGVWAGTLTVAGKTVEATGEGPQGLTLALARLWIMGSEAKEAAAPAVAAAKPPAPTAKPATVGAKKPG